MYYTTPNASRLYAYVSRYEAQHLVSLKTFFKK